MKKVLLIGEFNQTVSSVNKHLSTRFQTQICMDSLDMVKNMSKVFEPDLIVVCLIGLGELDTKILDYLKSFYEDIPVLLVGTAEECNYYKNYCEEKQFDCITRPTTLAKLMQKCLELLRLEKQKETKKDAEDEQPKKILLVDDSGILLRSLKVMLNKRYEVAAATDGVMAIEKAKKRKPDLILLDYEMPKMDGKETLEKLREDEELKDVPVVFLTGIADEKNVAAVLRLKPEGYLLKPIDQQRLFDTINLVLFGEL